MQTYSSFQQDMLPDLTDLCRLMAAAWRYPDKELAEGFSSGAFQADAEDCLSALLPEGDVRPTLFSSSAILPEAEELLHMMRHEYTSLFLVPKAEKVFLYESRFRWMKDPEEYAMFVTPCALHVEQLCREAGIRPAKGNREPLDQMATEWEFLAYLLGREMEAEEKNEWEVWHRRAAVFWRDHLDKWVFPFAEKVGEESREILYRELADLLKEAGKICRRELLSE